MKLKKYWEVFLFSLKAQINFLPNYIFSLISFGIFIFIFNNLWEYLLVGKELVGFTKQELLWYIIVAELVTCSSPRFYNNIADMIKTGDIAVLLTKPIYLPYYFFAENVTTFIKVGIYLIFGILIGLFFAGSIEMTIVKVFLFAIALVFGILTNILIEIIIGLTAFYTEENKAVHLILQKLGFFLVFTPLEFYPDFFQKVLLCLPTTYGFYVPAKIFSNYPGLSNAIFLVGMEILMFFILMMMIYVLYKKGVKKINVNGG